jgi:hypothetical protein
MRKRSLATVALDLRLEGRVAAVAVDRRGALAAWAVVEEPGDAATLARRALRDLQVRPKEVRVLLGAREAQVAVLSQAPVPQEKEIAAALFAEGYERLSEPAVVALALAPGVWLVAACGSVALEPLAAGLLAETGLEPNFTVDQLAAVEGLEAGSALIEHGATGLLVAARPAAGEPFVRFLPGFLRVEEATRESRASLAEAGFDGSIQVLGEHREALSGLLARRASMTRLASPRSERRRASLAWARRATRAALVVALLGVLAMAAGLRVAWKNRALHSQAAAEARLVGKLRETGALAGEAKRLQADLAGRAAPWPRVAETVAALARQLPPETGWERFEIKDGSLELEVSAVGDGARARLDLLRHTLEHTPGVLNLSWDAPSTPPHAPRLRQVFRATLGAP